MRDDDDRIFRDTFLEERSEERAHALLVTVTILLIVAVIAIAIMFSFFFMRQSAGSSGTVVGTIADKNGEIVIIQSGQEEPGQGAEAAPQTEISETEKAQTESQSNAQAETTGAEAAQTEAAQTEAAQTESETKQTEAAAVKEPDPAMIEQIMQQYSQASDWAVSVTDLETDKRIDAGNANEKMYTSATISVPILYTAAVLLDQGQITMEDQITYTNSIGGRGEYDPLWREGQNFPLSFYLQTMLTLSDNNCMNCLIDFLTLDRINSVCREAGFESVDLQRKIVAEVTDGSENYVSAADLAGMTADLYGGKYKTINTDFMTQYFRVDESDENRTLIGLSQNLKADDLFLNQNGRGDTRYSEAAVIGRGDRHLIVSVMLRGEYGFAYDEAVVKTADYILEQME